MNKTRRKPLRVSFTKGAAIKRSICRLSKTFIFKESRFRLKNRKRDFIL